MPIIEVLVFIVLLAFFLWLVTTLIPMEATLRRVLVGLVALVAFLYILQAFGFLPSLRLR